MMNKYLFKKRAIDIVCYIKEIENITNASKFYKKGKEEYCSEFYTIGHVRVVIDSIDYFNIFSTPFVGCIKSNQISKMLEKTLIKFIKLNWEEL